LSLLHLRFSAILVISFYAAFDLLYTKPIS